MDCDVEASLGSRSPGLGHGPPFPLRSGTRPGIHIRLIRNFREPVAWLIFRLWRPDYCGKPTCQVIPAKVGKTRCDLRIAWGACGLVLAGPGGSGLHRWTGCASVGTASTPP